jgi:serine kinase of HPr protein (carbohydrate metabolism regulator)
MKNNLNEENYLLILRYSKKLIMLNSRHIFFTQMDSKNLINVHYTYSFMVVVGMKVILIGAMGIAKSMLPKEW